MTERSPDNNSPGPDAGKPVGKGEGGADTSGPGNILAHELTNGERSDDEPGRD